jgi:glucose-fructose oxidoreductase
MAIEISRRSALIGLTGIAALSANPRALAEALESQQKPVGWALLGLGYYAMNLIAPAFAQSKNSKLVALISGHPEKLTRYGAQYNIPEHARYTYDTMDKIKDNPEIEVVYVVTPPATHPDFTVHAAHLGKHVCSEKPMAPTAKDCKRMIDACKHANRLLQIGYRCHYESHNLRAIQACRSGELGKLMSLSSDHGFNIGTGLWRTQKALAGGGSMMDIGIYALNALRYLSGEEPTHVEATIKSDRRDPRFVDCEDQVDFKLHFPSGLVGHGTSGYSWNPGKNRYEVVGDRATLLAEPATAYFGDTLKMNGNPVAIAANNQWAAQLDHFSDRIRKGGKVATPGEEGLKDIHIIEAIYASGDSSGKLMKL